VLAFGFGLVLGLTLDGVPVATLDGPVPPAAEHRRAPVADEPVAAERDEVPVGASRERAPLE
jgi:hypothetical protein